MTQNAKTKQAVAITGMGIITSLGIGVANFSTVLKHAQSNFNRLDYPLLSFPVIGAAIDNFNFSTALATSSHLTDDQLLKIKKITRQSPIGIQTATISALEAWQQANLHQAPINASEIGIVVAAQNSTSKYQYDLYSQFEQNPDYLPASYALHFMDSDYVGILSAILPIRGDGFTIGGATASGNMALLRACDLISNQSLSSCLVVGAQANLSPMDLQGFYNIGALGGERFSSEPNKACRPFDMQHNGFIYGQASACMVLESVTSAKQRKVPILGYILGGSCILDGNHLTNPNLNNEIKVMQKAAEKANKSLADIDYINAHGTAAPLGDEVEAQAIEMLLGHHCGNVFVNSTKSIVGHCLWSAAIVEAIATIIQLQQGFVHPTLNLEQPINNACRFVKEKNAEATLRVALSNSFGFGGINTSIVLAKDSL